MLNDFTLTCFFSREILPPLHLFIFYGLLDLIPYVFFCVLLYDCYILSLFMGTIYHTVILFIYLLIDLFIAITIVAAIPQCKADLTVHIVHLCFEFLCICCTKTF